LRIGNTEQANGMKTPPIPENEQARLKALSDYEILDTPPEKELDDLAFLASKICGCPIALISLVDGSRQWFKARVGLSVTETPKEVSFCAHAISQRGVFMVPDTQADDRFADNPLVTDDPHIRFYAGAPLVTPEGHGIGTLCIIDRVPRELTPEQKEALAVLSRQVLVRLEFRRITLALDRVNTEKTRLLAELRESYDRLRELEELRDNLTHMIVHDLRTPLMGISGYLQLLQMQVEGRLTPEQSESVQRARRSTAVLTEMISSMLDVSRLEAGQMPLQVEPCDLQIVAQDGIASLGLVGDEVHIVRDAPLEPVLISCDREIMRRVIANLVGNAVKHTPPQGDVRVTVAMAGSQARVEVIDVGPGIAQEYHEMIFKKFGQIEARDQKQGSSSGLGLTFCKLAVEAHGGRIGVDSQVGRGSTFWVELPAVPPVGAGARKGERDGHDSGDR
jgi:signal transduction histidine kinase